MLLPSRVRCLPGMHLVLACILLIAGGRLACPAQGLQDVADHLKGQGVVAPAQLDLNTDARVDAGDLGTANPATMAVFVPGEELQVVEQVVDEFGGIVEAPADSLLSGVRVEFPAGALRDENTVTISYNTGLLLAGVGEGGNPVLRIATSTEQSFRSPIQVTIPYGRLSARRAPPNSLPIPYTIAPDNTLELATITGINEAEGTMTIEIWQVDLITWIIDLLIPDIVEESDALLRPSRDGFQIVNFGSTTFNNGECLGMTTFAAWYYRNHRGSGNFYPRFMSQVGTSGLTGQDLIATRAFASVSSTWQSWMPTVNTRWNFTAEQTWRMIRNAMRNTGRPVLLAIFGNGGHSVLAYRYTTDENQLTHLYIYDPNKPNDNNVTITYRGNTKAFDAYGNYTRVVSQGAGSLALREPYSSILADAENAFNSASDATVTITSHASGDEVTDRIQTIRGTIASGELKVTEAKLFIDLTEYPLQLGTDGSFSATVPLKAGDNRIKMETVAVFKRQNQTVETRRAVTNTLDRTEFIIKGVFDDIVIRATLRWDTNDTDLDLYVIDPTGDFSAYYKRTTADGGVLDVDDVDGYGPENWTLTGANVIRWGEAYRVRVHHYSDHGNGPSNWTVQILTNENTPQEATRSYSGFLSADNPGNDGPTATGPDWADVANVIVTDPGVAPAIIERPGELPTILVPIAPMRERQGAKLERLR